MKITLTQISNRKLALRKELVALNKAAASARKKEEQKRLAKIAKMIVANDLDRLPSDVLTKALCDLKANVSEAARVA
jgi:hypothetical protein